MNLFELLVPQLLDARMNEESAKVLRISIEERISNQIKTPEVGQKTVTLSDGTKVTVKRGLNYTADLEAILGIFATLDTPAPVEQKTTWKLDVKGYEWYREHRPDLYEAMMEHIAVKPAKTSVSIKVPKE